PRHAADALRAASAEREARARLLAGSGPRVVDALRGGEGDAAVDALREEDVVVAQSVVLPRSEHVLAVHREARMPLVRRRVGVGIEADLRIVELDVFGEGRSEVG